VPELDAFVASAGNSQLSARLPSACHLDLCGGLPELRCWVCLPKWESVPIRESLRDSLWLVQFVTIRVPVWFHFGNFTAHRADPSLVQIKAFISNGYPRRSSLALELITKLLPKGS
jgi:hypothetical protein